MALIPFVEKAIDFRTDQGEAVRLSRPYLWIEWRKGDGNPFQWLAMYDSAAPLCVVPYSLWHDQQMPWRLLGQRLPRGEQAAPAALTWRGVPCQLGEVLVRLVDRATQIQSGLLRLRAKFPVAQVASFMEKEITLGQDFLLSNPTVLTMKGGAGQWQGVMLVD